MKKTTKKGQIFSFFSKAFPMLAATLVMLCIHSGTADAAVTEYPIWIGSTQVTSDNAGNILGETNPINGEPTASYDADTLTLTLNGVHITPDQYWVNDVHKDWNDPAPNRQHGGDYINQGPLSAVYSLFFGPISGRTFDYGKGGGNRGNIVIKGENVIDGYGVGILAGQRGKSYNTSDPNYVGVFSIIGNGTLRINQLYSEKDGVSAPFGALNILETPGKLNFGTEGGAGPKIICNGINNGLYSGYETLIDRRASSGKKTVDGDPICNYGVTATLYGDTVLVAQGGLRGFDARFFISTTPNIQKQDNQYVVKENATFYARAARYGAFTAYGSGGADHPYITGNIFLGKSLKDVGSWVAYNSGAITDQNKVNAAQIYLNLPIKDLQPGSESYTDPDINVWGFTGNGTVYSVDVEWGAMTFQYEKSSWDSEKHETAPGRGWLVYDAVNEKVLKSTQDTINQVTVTNHSNAGVYATLVYTGEDTGDDGPDTTGGFTKDADDADTSFTDAADKVPAYLTLATADNNKGDSEGQGKETTGSVYFMPEGIAKTGDTVNDITKWTKIGVITVGLQTEDPAATPNTP